MLTLATSTLVPLKGQTFLVVDRTSWAAMRNRCLRFANYKPNVSQLVPWFWHALSIESLGVHRSIR
jgi:hypothetical protein